jgi:hypothetical protein
MQPTCPTTGGTNVMRRTCSAVAIAVSLASIPACDSAPESFEKAATIYPQIIPSDSASIARWEASQYNAFRSKLEVVALKYFRDQLTEKGHAEATPVAVEMCGGLDSGVAGEQGEALRRFVASEPELYAKARAAIYDEYRRSYNTYKRAWSLGAGLFGGSTDLRKVLPEIVKGNELDGLISFKTVYVSRPEKGASRIGIVLDCPWDEENGMGLVIAGDVVERVGDAGTALAAMTLKPGDGSGHK